MKSHKNFCEVSLIISKGNSGHDVGLQDPKIYLFNFLHVKEVCPGRDVIL